MNICAGARKGWPIMRALKQPLAAIVVAVVLIFAASASAQTSPNCLIEIYKDYDAWWGEKMEEIDLQSLGFTPGVPSGYGVKSTSELLNAIPDAELPAAPAPRAK